MINEYLAKRTTWVQAAGNLYMLRPSAYDDGGQAINAESNRFLQNQAGYVYYALGMSNQSRVIVGGTFSSANQTGFHRADGEGYRFFADIVLEVERRNKTIGASLEAAPVVHLSPALAALITDADSFATLCITSALTLTTAPAPEGAFTMEDVPGVAVVFARAEGAKCQRCWKILPDVGTHKHPGTCKRCSDALG